MHRLHCHLLATTLALLFLVFSFNAYACLLPVNSGSITEMGTGCSTPEERPARQVCDTFKTLNVEASSQGQPTFDSQIVWFGEAVSGFLSSFLFTGIILKYPPPLDGSPQLRQTTTTVLRI